MAFLLSSSQTSVISLLSLSFPIKQQRPRVLVNSVSCRATKVIGRENNSTNFYELLSLSPNNANINEIKKAYRSKALQYHPDVCPPPMKEESTRIFVQLNAAYKTLSDPMLRKEYDCELWGLTNNYASTLKMAEDVARTSRQEQINGLKMRSNRRMAQKEGSRGSKIRAQNMRSKD
ncbi:hypothetical protein ACB098_07G059200 [Castanea mollissima]